MAKLYLIKGRIFYEDGDKLALVNGAILNSTTSGAATITGTGTPESQSATTIGTGERIVTGTGTLESQNTTVVGTGERVITGSGVLDSQISTVVGTGERIVTGTGILDSQDATVIGTGTVGGVVTGTGTLDSQVAVVAGTGTRIITGTGVLNAQDSVASGTGERVITDAQVELLADNGFDNAPSWDVSNGDVNVTNPSKLTLNSPLFTDASAFQTLGANEGKTYRITFTIVSIPSGSFTGFIGGTQPVAKSTVGTHSQIAKAGTSAAYGAITGGVTGTGGLDMVVDNVFLHEVENIQAQDATVTGTGTRIITGTGILDAQDSVVVGTGERVISGEGLLSAERNPDTGILDVSAWNVVSTFWTWTSGNLNGDVPALNNVKWSAIDDSAFDPELGLYHKIVITVENFDGGVSGYGTIDSYDSNGPQYTSDGEHTAYLIDDRPSQGEDAYWFGARPLGVDPISLDIKSVSVKEVIGAISQEATVAGVGTVEGTITGTGALDSQDAVAAGTGTRVIVPARIEELTDPEFDTPVGSGGENDDFNLAVGMQISGGKLSSTVVSGLWSKQILNDGKYYRFEYEVSGTDFFSHSYHGTGLSIPVDKYDQILAAGSAPSVSVTANGSALEYMRISPMPDLLSQEATVSGVGEVLGTITGTGSLLAQDAVVAGVGERVVTIAGDVNTLSNGDFANINSPTDAVDWTESGADFDFSGNTALRVGTQAPRMINSTIIPTVGKFYEVSFDILQNTGIGFSVNFGGVVLNGGSGNILQSSGRYTEVVQATAETGLNVLYVYAFSSETRETDNYTIREVGDIQAQGATVAGVGTRIITGTGALESQFATATGVGLRVITGDGALTSEPSTVAGVGLRLITGTGSLLSGPATMDGSGIIGELDTPSTRTVIVDAESRIVIPEAESRTLVA